MKTEFKVLEWLRQVRDQYAEETKGLEDEERLVRLRQETREWVKDLPRKPPVPMPRTYPACIHEDKAAYGRDHGPDKKHA